MERSWWSFYSGLNKYTTENTESAEWTTRGAVAVGTTFSACPYWSPAHCLLLLQQLSRLMPEGRRKLLADVRNLARDGIFAERLLCTTAHKKSSSLSTSATL